jgi:hypothetical protein
VRISDGLEEKSSGMNSIVDSTLENSDQAKEAGTNITQDTISALYVIYEITDAVSKEFKEIIFNYILFINIIIKSII